MVHFDDLQAQFADIIGLNRYHGWYTNEGQIEVVQTQVRTELYLWMNTYKKPLLFTEYGADTIAGLHYVINNYSLF
jgi:beta-glucuronidase